METAAKWLVLLINKIMFTYQSPIHFKTELFDYYNLKFKLMGLLD
jgi:hypothetical protein